MISSLILMVAYFFTGILTSSTGHYLRQTKVFWANLFLFVAIPISIMIPFYIATFFTGLELMRWYHALFLMFILGIFYKNEYMDSGSEIQKTNFAIFSLLSQVWIIVLVNIY